MRKTRSTFISARGAYLAAIREAMRSGADHELILKKVRVKPSKVRGEMCGYVASFPDGTGRVHPIME